jgi:hypothetical protein
MIKSRKMIWVGYVACLGEMRNAYGILVGKPEIRHYSGHLNIDGIIILKRILLLEK